MWPSLKVAWFRKLFFTGVICLTAIGFISLCYMLFTGQMGILDESIRRNISPKLNFLSAFFWFGYLILITEYISRKEMKQTNALIILITSCIIVVGLYVLIGYRTNLFMIVFTLILFFHYTFKRFNFIVVLILLIIISVSFSFFGHMRVAHEDKTIKFNQAPVEKVHLNTKEKAAVVKTKQMPEWFRVVTAEFVNGKVVLSRIVEYTDKNGSMDGQLHLAAFKTLLPGKTLSPRAIVTEKVNHLSDNGVLVTREGRTTTPSLLGQLFLDGGYVLLVIGIGFIAFLLTTLYNRLKAVDQSNYKIAYALITTLLIISIHTGFLDVITFVFLFAMLAYVLISNVNTNKKTEIG